MINRAMEESIYIRIPLKALGDLADVMSQIDEINTNIWSAELRPQVKKGHDLIEKAAGEHSIHIYAPDDSPAAQTISEVTHA